MVIEDKSFKLELDGAQIIQLSCFGGTTLVAISQLLTSAQLKVNQARSNERLAKMKMEFDSLNKRLDSADAKADERYKAMCERSTATDQSIATLAGRVDRILDHLVTGSKK